MTIYYKFYSRSAPTLIFQSLPTPSFSMRNVCWFSRLIEGSREVLGFSIGFPVIPFCWGEVGPDCIYSRQVFFLCFTNTFDTFHSPKDLSAGFLCGMSLQIGVSPLSLPGLKPKFFAPASSMRWSANSWFHMVTMSSLADGVLECV